MRIVNKRGVMIDSLIELVGIKAGVALDEDRLTAILESGFDQKAQNAFILGGPQHWWQGDRDEMVFVRAEEIEFDFLFALRYLGAIPDLQDTTRMTAEFARNHASDYNVDPRNLAAVYQLAMKVQVELLRDSNEEDPGSRERVPFADDPDFVKLKREFARRDIMNFDPPEDREWDGKIPLNDLFESEAIPASTTGESYFDQRFIDYLAAQPQDLTSIKWRQFEYLTAEYFKRNGYDVTVGRGRKDGGVDIFATKLNEIVGPDLVVIQCRRYGDDQTVGVEGVKAFWATVNDAGATRGLIATTSRLTRGARSYCNARRYRLTPIEGDSVNNWLREMANS